MENDNKWLVLLKGISFPFFILVSSASIGFLLINFLINVFISLHRAYFIDGTLLKPVKVDINMTMLLETDYLFTTMPVLFVTVLFSSLIGIYVMYKWKSNFASFKKDQKGSARFATIKEIKKQYRLVPQKVERFNSSGGVPVGRIKDEILIDDSAVNNLVIGTTRSGKGETFVFSTIDIYSRATEQASMILNDPKGELYAASKETLERLGYQVEVLNLMNPLQSMSYNLLQLTIDAYMEGNFSLAQQYARSVAFMLYNDPTAKDKIWSNASISLCTALILAVCEINKHDPSKITMYNVALMLTELSSEEGADEGGDGLIEFFKQFPANHPAKLQFATYEGAKGATRGSIFMNTITPLGIFTLDGTAKLTSQNTLNMAKIGFGRWIKGQAAQLKMIEITFPNGKTEKIKTDAQGNFTLYHRHEIKVGDTFSINDGTGTTKFHVTGTCHEFEDGHLSVEASNLNVVLNEVVEFTKPLAVFMIVPDYDQTFNIISSLYVKQVYTVLARISSNTRAGKCDREVIFILDEFGNMPAIESFASILTVCLGRNIRFNLIVQAYSQIEHLYGESWKTIDGNCGNTIYLLTADFTTAEIISKKLGDETITTKSRSGQSLSLDKSKTENVDSRSLLTPNEVMRLKEGEAIILRVIKRQDKERKRITSFPILLTEKDGTAFKYRWEYLGDQYDTDKSINDINIACSHANVSLDDLKIDFKAFRFGENEAENASVINDVVFSNASEPDSNEELPMGVDESLVENNRKLSDINMQLNEASRIKQQKLIINQRIKIANYIQKSLLKTLLIDHNQFEKIFADYDALGLYDFEALFINNQTKFKREKLDLIRKKLELAKNKCEV